MASKKITRKANQIAKPGFSLQSTPHLTQCKTSLWSPLTTVGIHPQWAHMCANGLDTALNYLRETEPLALEPVAVYKNDLRVVPCENSPLVRVQSVHVISSVQDSPLPSANITTKQGVQELPDPLSEREIEILLLLAAGYSNQEIANALIIATSTVKWYLKQIYSKLGVHSRTQAVAHARQLGLLS